MSKFQKFEESGRLIDLQQEADEPFYLQSRMRSAESDASKVVSRAEVLRHDFAFRRLDPMAISTLGDRRVAASRIRPRAPLDKAR
jgi:hypothetical protein